MHHPSWRLVCLVAILGISDAASAQLLLRGMVADSLSVQPLPNVNIRIKNADAGTVSDIRGAFLLEAAETDTVIFSRVGYHTKVLPARVVAQMVIIFLKEEHRMLAPVEISHGDGPFAFPRPPAEPAWRNSTNDKSFTEAPGFRGVQTFGPGYILRMPGSGFAKEAKEKEKLRQVREENRQARDYIQLVNDPQVKGRIMTDYHLSETEYYALLARFNEKNKDIIYRLDAHEVIPLLLDFYAQNAGSDKKQKD